MPDILKQGSGLMKFAMAAAMIALVSWVPAQIAWVQYPAPAFSSPINYKLAYDTIRAKLLAFGFQQTTPFGTLVEIQERTGLNWQQVQASTFLAWAAPRVLVFDSVRDRVVWVTESAGVAEWDRVSLTTIPQSQPPTIQVLDGCYDPVRQTVVVVGRQNNQPNGMETWEWNGLGWTRVQVSQELPGDFRAVGFNPASGRLMAVGMSATYELAGGSWVAVGPPTPQLGLFGGGWIEYDAVAGRMLCSLVPTHEWDGALWVSLRTSGFPANARPVGTPTGVCAPGIYQAVRTPTATLTAFGAGCSGALGPITTVITPATIGSGGLGLFLGTPLTVQVSGLTWLPFAHWWLLVGSSRTALDGTPLPLDLSIFNMPGCQLRVSIDMMLQAAGDTIRVGVPASYSFLGLPYYIQVLVQDFGANGPVMALGDAYEGIVGVPQ